MSHSPEACAPSIFGRLLIAGICAPFVFSAIDKLLDWADASKEMLDLGLPHSDLIVFAVVVVQLGCSLLAVFARRGWAAVGSLGLAVFTLGATRVAHAFWNFHGRERLAEMSILVEHVSIVFALLTVAWLHTRTSESISRASVDGRWE